MSELPPAAPATDPSLLQGVDPTALHRYDLLKQQPDVVVMNLAESGPQEVELAAVQPLAVEGQTALIASLQLGREKHLQVWGGLQSDGSIDRRGVIITEENYDPADRPAGLVAVHAGQPTTHIGRANAQVQERLHLPGTVSRNHLAVEVTTEGRLRISDTDSTNGSELLVKRPVEATESTTPSGRRAAAESQLPSAEAVGPRFEDRFKPVSEDPLFQQLTAPYHEHLNTMQAAFRQEKQGIEQAMQQARNHDSNEYYELEHRLQALEDRHRQEAERVRRDLEATVKPYLAARLQLFKGDTAVGYTHDGELAAQNQALVSRAGKTIAHYVPGMKGPYMQTNVRLGQVRLPERLSSWAGSNGEKVNHQTGVRTTSTRHIVDLAAAMVAGTWKAEHEPIVLRRDTAAEYGLPKELQGKLPLYKVQLGMHRIAAMRLIDGLDGIARADEIIEA